MFTADCTEKADGTLALPVGSAILFRRGFRGPRDLDALPFRAVTFCNTLDMVLPRSSPI
jgi:hypothetical protein